jgi:hypothetical protein
MTTGNFDITILGAVYKKDKQLLKELYSKDRDSFVFAAYRLFRNGLIIPKKNFVEGGDSNIPTDVLSPDNFKATSHGITYWKMSV